MGWVMFGSRGTGIKMVLFGLMVFPFTSIKDCAVMPNLAAIVAGVSES